MLQENLQWNGITSKKKGQKWGIEKVASYKRNEWTSLNEEGSEMLVDEKATIANNPVDFDKLTPYTSVPNVRFFHTSIVFPCILLRLFHLLIKKIIFACMDLSFFPSPNEKGNVMTACFV